MAGAANFWEEKLHPQDASRVVESMHKMVSQGHDYSSEYRMMAVDDRVVWLRESGTVIIEKGKPVAVRASSRISPAEVGRGTTGQAQSSVDEHVATGRNGRSGDWSFAQRW